MRVVMAIGIALEKIIRLSAILALTLTATATATAQTSRFEGKIARDAVNSVPHWPEERKPPNGAPNILIWLMDDVGFGHTSPYGGLVDTPNIERVARAGLQFTDFHSTPLCSPTRASLLTGRNPHTVAVGAHANTASGFPGYNVRIPRSAAGMGRLFTDAGYATTTIGKWDQLPPEHTSQAGPFDYWPSGQGFQHFYGFLHYDANHYQPTLWQDHSPLDNPENGNPDYHLTEDLADKAIQFIESQHATDPARPFLIYWSTGAVHAPHHAPPAYINKYRGRFDLGWNAARDVILDRQKQRGVMPDQVELPTWPDELPSWADLSQDQKLLATRAMEAFAGMLDHADHHFGRILDTLEAMGKLENTLVIVVSDNGASAEGGPAGTFNELLLGGSSWEENLKHLDTWGGPETYPHYQASWAVAGNTPFKFYKQSSFEGGNRVPMIISWPRGLSDSQQMRRQYHHVNDILPTILDLAGIPAPAEVGGVEQLPFDGISMRYALQKTDEPTRKKRQYYELWGNRGIWAEGWKANLQLRPEPWNVQARPGVDSAAWHLYDTRTDINELNDLSHSQPEKLAEMQSLFDSEAHRYQVYPLLPDSWSAAVERESQRIASRSGRYTYSPQTTRIPVSVAPPIDRKPFTLLAELELSEQPPSGVIFSFGGHDGGLAFFIDQGKPALAINRAGLEQELIESNHRLPENSLVKLTLQVEHISAGQSRVNIQINGEVAARKEVAAFAGIIPAHETFDIGQDLGSPVAPLYPARAPFDPAVLKKVTVEIPSN